MIKQAVVLFFLMGAPSFLAYWVGRLAMYCALRNQGRVLSVKEGNEWLERARWLNSRWAAENRKMQDEIARLEKEINQ